MPTTRESNGLFHQVEFRDGVMFRNGDRIARIENCVSVERDRLDDEQARVARELERLTGVCCSAFMETLNACWGGMDVDFELGDEEEYVATDPISFDELMGGCCGDN